MKKNYISPELTYPEKLLGVDIMLPNLSAASGPPAFTNSTPAAKRMEHLGNTTVRSSLGTLGSIGSIRSIGTLK